MKWVLLLIASIGCLLLTLRTIDQRWSDQNEEAAHLAIQIKPGMSRTEVAELFARYQQHVAASLVRWNEEWTIYNPTQFGAQDRNITVTFDANGRVLHRTLRTMDRPGEPIPGAPADF